MRTIKEEVEEYIKKIGKLPLREKINILIVFEAAVEFGQRWISVEDELPTGEDEVLLFNKKWINKDYNPKGIRIGFLGGDGFISAHWWNYQDCYMTISKNECENNSKFSDDIKNNTEPTHWRPIEIK